MAGVKIPMNTTFSKFKNKKKLRVALEGTRESESEKLEQSRLVNILDAHYKATDIEDKVIKAEN